MRGWATSLLLALGTVSSDALAEPFPERPVRIVVPFSPGGPVDLIARTVGQKLAETWKQPVTVVNRPGAGGTIGVGEVAKASGDGYTLLVHSSSYTVNQALYVNLPYDAQKDLTEIAPLAALPTLLVVSSAAGVRSVAELIARAKAKPGELAYASAGTGTITHIIGEKFRLAAGVDVLHVPYKGGNEANADTIAGRVAYTFAPASIAIPHVRDGKLVALAVSSARRSSQLPDVPTISEAALRGFDFTPWYGMWVPSATPSAIAAKLSSDVERVTQAPDLLERLAKAGFEPLAMPRQDFARFVRAETIDVIRVVRAAGIKLE
jgi:tripartite-type tricarboxylate transporter receptor subunit TctC